MSNLRQVVDELTLEERSRLELRLMQKRTIHANPAIPRRQIFTPCPLSFAQQRLWFLNQLAPHSPFYNVAKAFRLSGALNVKALQQALDAIVDRHEVLHTTFDTVDGHPMQVIAKEWPTVMTLIDLSTCPAAERDAKAQPLLGPEAQRPFELSRDLMLRATLICLSAQEHILLLVWHHIASDRWSAGVLLRELSVFYTAFSHGEPIPLPALAIQYADFAAWQQAWLQGNVLEVQLDYWKAQLAGVPPMLELPTDRPRPPEQTFRGARSSFMFPKGLSAALRALSQREGVTLFMTLLAGFKTLIYRYTGQESVVIGTPIANRTRVGIERLIGFFANTLVLRTDLSGDPSFQDVLARVRRVALGAYDHQDLPFEKLVEELQPERTLSYNPLFQVMFNFRNTPEHTLELPDLAVEVLPQPNETEQFDLALSITDEPEGLQGVLSYNTDLFDAATVERMAGHYRTLLETISIDPQQPISALVFLPTQEQQQLLVEWNETKAARPSDQCVHELFEEQVRRSPQAVAVVYGREQLTYQALNQRANQVAHYLKKQGVGPDVLVGICMERSVQMLVGLLGTLKAGGAYVPLDPTYPNDRLEFILEDTQTPILLIHGERLPNVPKGQARVINLEIEGPDISQESMENPVGAAGAENLAYVMYTSGSTGQPKGVMVCHRGVYNYLLWRQSIFPLTATDRTLQKTSFSFVDSVWELFEPLMVGAQVMMAAPGGDQDPAYLVKFISEQMITAADFIPSMLHLFLEEPGVEKCDCLRRVTTGSETVSVELLERFFARLDADLYNLYGPTEASIASTYWPCKRGSALRSIPIGRPISNTQIYLLDHSLQPVPIGVPGELHIGGIGLARGYLNVPELTAEKFIPDPFSNELGARLYKTGDLARYLPDGNIEFLGRIDHQVKIRGFRIEPGEIESALMKHPAVRETTAVIREDIPGEKRLVAYVVASQEQVRSVTELRAFLTAKLPGYMIPSVIVMLEALPLTPNGKVDRRALPVPDQKRPEHEEASTAPRTLVEEVVAGIWSELLGVDHLGIHDNFFDLGGHSLLAIRLISRVRSTLNADLPLRTLFEKPTVAGLAESILAIQSVADKMGQPHGSPADKYEQGQV